MAKFRPRINVKLEIEDEDGSVKETFTVAFKEPSKKELRKAGSGLTEAIDMYSSIMDVNEDIKVLNENIEAFKRFEDVESEKKAIKQRDKLRADLKKMALKFEEVGGSEKSEEAERIRLNLAINGDDKDKVMALADDTGVYGEIYQALKEDAEKEKGKH